MIRPHTRLHALTRRRAGSMQSDVGGIVASITGLNSASIFVADLPLHVDFYTNQLGFTFVHDESSERAAMLEAGDFRLLLHDGGPTAAPSNLATLWGTISRSRRFRIW